MWDNNVLLVVVFGNIGGEMFVLGKVVLKFDNIIIVGVVNKLEEVVDYLSWGDILILVVFGG